LDGFIEIEESIVLGLDVESHVIATGGSVIYSEAAMRHLKAHGIVVFLNTKMYQLERRLKNAKTRGIAMKNGQTLQMLFGERTPLYRKYADIDIDCAKKHIEAIVTEISQKIKIFIG
jgi:shikimate kinase